MRKCIPEPSSKNIFTGNQLNSLTGQFTGKGAAVKMPLKDDLIRALSIDIWTYFYLCYPQLKPD